jgi:large subunit ribosomal protein L32
MPNPKWRHSKRRKRARRTHDKAAMPALTTCPVTGERHVMHRAYKIDGNLYYRGQLLIPAKETGSAAEA